MLKCLKYSDSKKLMNLNESLTSKLNENQLNNKILKDFAFVLNGENDYSMWWNGEYDGIMKFREMERKCSIGMLNGILTHLCNCFTDFWSSDKRLNENSCRCKRSLNFNDKFPWYITERVDCFHVCRDTFKIIITENVMIIEFYEYLLI